MATIPPLLDLLKPLELAVDEIANTWHPTIRLIVDTPIVTPEERAEELRRRVCACQWRRRW